VCILRPGFELHPLYLSIAMDADAIGNHKGQLGGRIGNKGVHKNMRAIVRRDVDIADRRPLDTIYIEVKITRLSACYFNAADPQPATVVVVHQEMKSFRTRLCKQGIEMKGIDANGGLCI